MSSAIASLRQSLSFSFRYLAAEERAAGEAAGRSAQRRSLPPKLAFYLLASITVSFLAASSAPTPLYATYQALWGFSPITVTVIFGIYAIAVLASLLVMGRLSDHLGRRPILLGAVAVQLVATLIFATADGVGQLLLGRVVQGLAAGAALGAIGAGMVDLDRERGTVANAGAPTFGTATGGLLGGVVVQFLPAPTHLVFAILGVVLLAQLIGVIFMAETISPRAGALASLKPQFSLPPATRGPFLLAVPVFVAVWSVASLYGSVGPSMLRSMTGTNSPLLGGLALTALAASSGIAVLLLQKQPPQVLMNLGAAALALGVAVAVLALPHKAVAVFFLGSVIAGIGFGAGFQGAMRTILPYAEAHQRAGVLSLIFVVSYLALGVPAVIAGAFIVRTHDVLGTAQGFGAAVIALSLSALLGAAVRAATRRVAAA